MPPLLTIATVIKPPAPGFDKTRESVLREFGECRDVEWLVKIKDGKLKIEEREETGNSNFQSSIFNYQFSLREIRTDDTGVFDGMNQAFEMAKGEWILFLNAGDWLAKGMGAAFREAVARHAQADFFFFEGVTVDAGDGREFLREAPDSLSLRDFLQRVPVLHPCLVVRRSVLRNLAFDTRMDLAADFDLMVRLVAGSYAGVHIPRIGAFVLSGGLSEQYRIRARRQAARSLLRNGPGGRFRFSVGAGFLRFLGIHFLIVGLIRKIPFLQRRARARSGGKPAGTYEEEFGGSRSR